MKKITKHNFAHILLLIISWVIFAGLGIETGAMISGTIARLVAEPTLANKFWQVFDLAALHAANPTWFILQMTALLLISLLKTFLFYSILRILHSRETSLSQPFGLELQGFTFRFAYISLAIGLMSAIALKLAQTYTAMGVQMPSTSALKIEGADIWIFMSITLFIIAQIIKRGVSLQQENDLTV